MVNDTHDKNNTYFSGFIGFNAALSGHGILLPLYIDSIGGTIQDFGIITAVYNAITIISLILWGRRSDRTGQRKRFILLGMFTTGIILSLFTLASNPQHLLLTHALLGCFSTAGVPASTMLIVEHYPRKDWEDKLGEYNTNCGVGLAIGLLMGTFLLITLNFQNIYLIFSMAALLSTLMSFLLIRDPSISLERHPVVTTVPRLGMFERVRIWAFSIHHLPSLSAFTNFHKQIRSSLTQDLPLFYLAVFLLFTASNMIFVPLPLILRYLGLVGSLIFFLYLINNLSATSMYRIAAKRMKKLGNARSMFLIAGIRGFLFVSLAVIKVLNSNQAIVLIGVMLILAGMSWAFMNTASSALTLELSPLENRGQTLGGLNAMIGSGVVLGALLGSSIADCYGFYISCLCAAGIQFFGVGLLWVISSHRKRRPAYNNFSRNSNQITN